MKTITSDKALTLIKKSKGQVFSVFFTKKNGEDRKMNCRIGVSKNLKGIGLPYNPADHDLVTVYDMQAKDYRMLNLSTLKALQIKGEFYVISGDENE